ncbi:MAG: hypothetical protein FWG23_06925 [Eggerthellaceae bacterium]|nr:hypothetical protein [Eggerthellaceae bacterium]
MCFRPPTAEKEEAICPECETANSRDDVVCSSCGATLPRLAPPPGVAAPVAPGAAAKVPVVPDSAAPAPVAPGAAAKAPASPAPPATPKPPASPEPPAAAKPPASPKGKKINEKYMSQDWTEEW